MALEPVEARSSLGGGLPSRGSDRRDRRIRGFDRVAGRDRIADELRDPVELGERFLRVEAGDRPTVVTDERVAGGGNDRRQALEPGGHRG